MPATKQNFKKIAVNTVNIKVTAVKFDLIALRFPIVHCKIKKVILSLVLQEA